MFLKMSNSFEFHPLTPDELAQHLRRRRPRNRVSKGRELIEQFLAENVVAATHECTSPKDRDSLSTSARTFLRGKTDLKVWVRKESPTELLLINVDLADDDTKSDFEAAFNRGRQA